MSRSSARRRPPPSARRTGPRAARAPPARAPGQGRDRVSSSSSSSRVERQRVLRDLGEPGAERRDRGASRAASTSASTATRLVERAHQVLALGEVHGGLAADRRVHLRRQRRGHLHERHARACTSRPRTRRGRRSTRPRARPRRRRGAPPGWRAGAAASRRPGATSPPRPRARREQHGVEPGLRQAAREGPEPAVDDRAVGHDERLRRRPGARAAARRPAPARPRPPRRRRTVPGPGRSRGPTRAPPRSPRRPRRASRCRPRRGRRTPGRAARASREQPLEIALLADQRAFGRRPHPLAEQLERHVEEHHDPRVPQRDPVRRLQDHAAAAGDHRRDRACRPSMSAAASSARKRRLALGRRRSRRRARPCSRSISTSRSTNGTPRRPASSAPTVGLARARASRRGRRSRQRLQVALEVARGSRGASRRRTSPARRSPARTPRRPPRPRRRPAPRTTSVRCLIATASVCPWRGPPSRAGLRHGRERLHRGAHADRLARAHPALDAAGAGRARARAAPPRSTISSWAFEPGRAAVANPSPTSTPFTDWMLISASGEPGVELAVPVDVGAEPRRARRTRAPRTRRRPCPRLPQAHRSRPPSASRPRGPRSGPARRRSPPGPAGRGGVRRAGTRTLPICTTWEITSMPSARQERLAQRPDRDPRRRLAGARALEHVPHVVEPVLLTAGEIRVSRAWAREAVRRVRLALDAPSGPGTSSSHSDVRDRDGDRASRACGRAARRPGSRTRSRLEPLAAAPPVPVTAPGELVARSRRTRHGHARGQALEDGDERLAVGFTGREQAQHAPIIGNRRTAPSGATEATRPRATAERCRGGPKAAPADRRPLPPWADRRGFVTYFGDVAQSVNCSSPNRNVAQSPEIDGQLELPLGERLALGDAVDLAVDLDLRDLAAATRERVEQDHGVAADRDAGPAAGLAWEAGSLGSSWSRRARSGSSWSLPERSGPTSVRSSSRAAPPGSRTGRAR